MKKTQKKYDTSQEILYQVCETGWNLCRQYLSDFAELKPYYTAEYIDKALKAAKDAAQLTDSKQTLGNRKQKRKDMVAASKKVLHTWQILKLYLTNAYAEDRLDIMLTAAGASIYKKAAGQSWVNMRSVINAGTQFISARFGELVANQNMPENFPQKWQQVSENFENIAKIFFEVKVERERITYCKIQANNKVYQTLISMLRDAQLIFRDQPEIKKQLVFSNMVAVYENKKATTKSVANANNKTAQHNIITSENLIRGEVELTDVVKKVALGNIAKR